MIDQWNSERFLDEPVIFTGGFTFNEGEQNYNDDGNREFSGFFKKKVQIYDTKSLQCLEVSGSVEDAKIFRRKGIAIRRKLC